MKMAALVQPLLTEATTEEETNTFCVPSRRTQYRQVSFFTRTIQDWNGLPQEVVTAESLDCFMSRLNSLL